jgi:hypothetical protein
MSLFGCTPLTAQIAREFPTLLKPAGNVVIALGTMMISDGDLVLTKEEWLEISNKLPKEPSIQANAKGVLQIMDAEIIYQ